MVGQNPQCGRDQPPRVGRGPPEWSKTTPARRRRDARSEEDKKDRGNHHLRNQRAEVKGRALLCGNGSRSSQAFSHQPAPARGVMGGQQGEIVLGRWSRDGKRLDGGGFQGLSNLPRDLFLGGVLRCAHGADQTRRAAASGVEDADLEVLPGSLLLSAIDVDVQPDVWSRARRCNF